MISFNYNKIIIPLLQHSNNEFLQKMEIELTYT